jgi:surface antigen
MVVHVAVTVLLAFIVLGSLIAVVPTGTEGKGYNIFSPIVKYFSNKSTNNVLLAQQAATATAVTQDGYDPGNTQTFAGVPTAPPSYGGGGTGTGTGGVGNHFFWGQCTFWAAFRYHQLTGLWVPWLGNAADWAYNAPGYGWHVGYTPRVGSIIVLAPGVQGSGGYGHVAIVESINADGSVNTSNFNWGYGDFGVMTYHTFYPGYGVTFVWA